MALNIGDTAPNFTLWSTDKKEVSLSDYDGQNVLVLFFPQAFTGGCVKEMCSVRDDIASYNNMNVPVLGISVDSVATLIHFKEHLKLNFTLLSDFNKQAMRYYDAMYEEFVLGMKGVAKRSAFVVDSSGIIQYAEVLDNAGKIPDFIKIKEVLSSLS